MFESLQDVETNVSIAETKTIELLQETLLELDSIMQNGYTAAHANISKLQ